MGPEADAQTVQPTLTFGQKAVGVSFNPSGNADVRVVKQTFADLIDRFNNLREAQPEPNDLSRLAAVTITELQTAQMWAVKALTRES